MSSQSWSELEQGRDLGAAVYLSAFVRLMARQLDVEGDDESFNTLAVEMTEMVACGTEAAFLALMGDRAGALDAVGRLQADVEVRFGG